MIAVAVAALMSLGSIEARFGEPSASVAGFDMPVKAGVFAVAKARHSVLPNGEVMLFIAGAGGAQLDRDLASGPVAHVRVRELPRGLAIVLTPTAKMSAEDVRFVDGHLKVDGKQTSEVGSRASDLGHQTSDIRASEVRSQTSEVRVPKSEIRTTAQPQTAQPQTEQPRAEQPQTEQPQIDQPRTEKPKKSFTPAPESSSSPLRTFFTLTVLLAAGAAAIVFNKKRKLQKMGAALDGIEVVSVKALGTKQRLAVVEVSGERMLIAASDQGLQLLSKLGDAPTRRETQQQPLTQAQSLSDFASALEDARNDAPVELQHPKPKTRRSTDVAGLIKLRAASAWTLGEGGDLT